MEPEAVHFCSQCQYQLENQLATCRACGCLYAEYDAGLLDRPWYGLFKKDFLRLSEEDKWLHHQCSLQRTRAFDESFYTHIYQPDIILDSELTDLARKDSIPTTPLPAIPEIQMPQSLKPEGIYMDATSINNLGKDPWRSMDLKQRKDAARMRSEFMERQVRKVEVDVIAYRGVEKLIMSDPQWTHKGENCEDIPIKLEVPENQSVNRVWIALLPCSQVEAALIAHHNEPNSRIGVVNMTSRKGPGVGYLLGDVGSEEFLFHATTLGPGLMAHKEWWGNTEESTSDTIRIDGLLGDVIMYSPDIRVLFFDGVNESPPEMQAKMDVFSIAPVSAPKTTKAVLESNSGKPKKTSHSLYEDPRDADHVRDQIMYIIRAAMAKNINILILPAYGCGGTYRHPVSAVVEIFKEVLSSKEVKTWRDRENPRVYLALLEVDNEGNPIFPGGFWRTFVKAFDKCEEAFIDHEGFMLFNVLEKIALRKTRSLHPVGEQEVTRDFE